MILLTSLTTGSAAQSGPPPKKKKKNVDLFESSDESDTVTATIVTPPKKMFKSKDKAYNAKENAQPGDLVMATAGDIDHPALEYGAHTFFSKL